MTRASNFKKVVRRHAEETGKRYTEALTDLEGVDARMTYSRPDGAQVVAHLRDRYGIDAVEATQISVHHSYVFRVDLKQGEPWVARVFPPGRSRTRVEGDAAILRFLEDQGFPAERLAVDDAVSDLNDRAVLVTRFIVGEHFPIHADRPVLGDLLGRLHSLPLPSQGSVNRPGGATGDDPHREGRPGEDLAAALALLDSVDTKVAAENRARFEWLRDRVRSTDDGEGLPESLVHGNLFHSPHHVLVADGGPVLISWKASGCGPRLVPDVSELVVGTPKNDLAATVHAYRRHVELTGDELDRLESTMWLRPLNTTCFVYHRNLTYGLEQDAFWWVDPPEMFGEIAAAVRAAVRSSR